MDIKNAENLGPKKYSALRGLASHIGEQLELLENGQKIYHRDLHVDGSENAVVVTVNAQPSEPNAIQALSTFIAGEGARVVKHNSTYSGVSVNLRFDL